MKKQIYNYVTMAIITCRKNDALYRIITSLGCKFIISFMLSFDHDDKGVLFPALANNAFDLVFSVSYLCLSKNRKLLRNHRCLPR